MRTTRRCSVNLATPQGCGREVGAHDGRGARGVHGERGPMHAEHEAHTSRSAAQGVARRSVRVDGLLPVILNMFEAVCLIRYAHVRSASLIVAAGLPLCHVFVGSSQIFS